MNTVADQFTDAVAAAGLKWIVGIVGDSPNGLTNARYRQVKIGWMHVRHGEIAALPADAGADLAGKLGVCAGSGGPDNPHMINGLFDCHRSRMAMPAIAAQFASTELGSGCFSATPPQTLLKECIRFCELTSGSKTLPAWKAESPPRLRTTARFRSMRW
jgi:pyruvate dehydrogenase (quinone)